MDRCAKATRATPALPLSFLGRGRHTTMIVVIIPALGGSNRIPRKRLPPWGSDGTPYCGNAPATAGTAAFPVNAAPTVARCSRKVRRTTRC